MHIRRYAPADEEILYYILTEEGDARSEPHSTAGHTKCQRAAEVCVPYLLFANGTLWGYARCHADCGFGVYVHDLLVRKKHRGHQVGRMLLEQFCRDFPDQTVYMLSNADPYYETLSHENIGSILRSNRRWRRPTTRTRNHTHRAPRLDSPFYKC
jgi:GNAT superfamily N-acetyltransferase